MCSSPVTISTRSAHGTRALPRRTRGPSPSRPTSGRIESRFITWLLGINSHIGLDLAIAAVDATAAGEVDRLRADFELINGVLADLIDQMQHRDRHRFPVERPRDRVGPTSTKLS